MCLDFHKSKQTVTTLSLAQVRQPINNNSVERLKRYEKHLQPLIDALGDVVKLAVIFTHTSTIYYLYIE